MIPRRLREAEAELADTQFVPAIESPYRWRDWAEDPAGITGDDLIAFINQDETVRPDGTRGAGLFAYLRSLSGRTAATAGMLLRRSSGVRSTGW